MDNKTIHDRFRQQFTNVHALTVLTVSLIEVIGYIVLCIFEIEKFSLANSYLWFSVILPITVNITTHIIARAIVNKPHIRRRKKNATIIYAALITSFVVAISHREYIVTSCAFIFPMILSAMFNNKKLLNTSFVGSILILFSVVGAFFIDGSITLKIALDLIVLFVFAFISYLCGAISINFSSQSFSTIQAQAEENDKLLEDILHDQMTGLYNHTSFFEHLEEAICSFTEHSSLCLAVIDIDDFKKVNDTYGHDCGDIVLIDLANTLKKHCNNHRAYRYGGEEFAIVFVDISLNGARKIIQNALNDFSSRKYDFTDKPITFSAGITAYSPNLTPEEFFENADRTLYKAKGEGKKQVLVTKDTYSFSA